MALKAFRTTSSALALTILTAASAQADVNIGYLADLSGGTSMLSGESSLRAIEMAIADFGGTVNGEAINVLSADHLGRPDNGMTIAREWIDTEGVDLVFSADHSAVALAISDLVRDRDVAFIHGATSSALTGESCGPNQIQMLIDNVGLSRAITIPLLRSGLDKWFYITVDYAFGHSLEDTARAAIEANGGTFAGSVSHSPQATDYSAFLLEAQASGANVIGLATFGAFQVAIAKQAQEFGIELPLAPFFLGITDIQAAGLDSFQNVRGAIQFYWNQNDATRAFSARFAEVYGRPPTFTNAMVYEYITHYLNAVQAVGSDQASLVIPEMRAHPIQMINGDTATIREDGRTLRPMYAYRTLTPAESTGPWDFLEILETLPADSLAPPLSESTCPLIVH